MFISKVTSMSSAIASQSEQLKQLVILKDADFESYLRSRQVATGKKPVMTVVMFYVDYCPYVAKALPIFIRACIDAGIRRPCVVDLSDHSSPLRTMYERCIFPSFRLFENGSEVRVLKGTQELKDLQDLIAKDTYAN